MKTLTKTEALYQTMHNAEPKYRHNNQGIIRLRHWLRFLPKPPASIVEIGCGNGRLCELLVAMKYLAWGVDVTEGPYEREDYTFAKCNIVNVPWNIPRSSLNGMYDCCLSFDVLEHLKEEYIDSVLDEMWRVSRSVVLSIACFGQDGVLHLTVRSPEWWITKLISKSPCHHFSFEIITELKGETLIFYGRKEE